jgi:hypothetical protein
MQLFLILLSLEVPRDLKVSKAFREFRVFKVSRVFRESRAFKGQQGLRER